MNDEALMNKHKLSAEQLRSILTELDEAGLIVKIGEHYEIPAMRSIAAADIISDIRSGSNSSELMGKYGLTIQTLANTVRLLIDGNHLSRADMAGRERLFEEVMDPGSAREHGDTISTSNCPSSKRPTAPKAGCAILLTRGWE